MSTTTTALLLAAGRVVATPALRAAAASAEVVIAADGGLRHARSLGVTPDLLVGDLDSVDEGALRRWPQVARRTHPRDKDALDLELALDEVRARGAERVLLVGALGDRLDQGLAALSICEALHRDGVDVTLDSGDARVLPLRPGETRHAPLAPGTTVSVIATQPDTVVSLTGTRWTLDRHALPVASGHGVSNLAAGDGPRLTLHAGGCILIVPQLPTPAAGTIWGEHVERVEAGLHERDTALAELIRRVVYDDVFERPELDLRTRELLAVAHLLSVGRERELRTHVIGALRAGATPDELRALLLHAAVFVGVPRALAAADVVREVLADRPS